MQPIVWIGSSRSDVRAFPTDARRDAGYQLGKVQNGDDPDDWKPMSSIGLGVREIRLREESGAFRIIYVARFADAIYVLHAFRKTTQKTRDRDMELARSRFHSLRNER